jgi:hypothetical protein
MNKIIISILMILTIFLSACSQVDSVKELKIYECAEPRSDPAATTCPADEDSVCANVQVQCIKAPCDPIKQTFRNSCQACLEKTVLSYTEGACEDAVNQPKACTEDAKVCDDGTSVVRDANNNCEFYPCPESSGSGEAKIYVSEDLEQCKLIRYMCEGGKEPFSDDKGCGCQTALASTCGNGVCDAGEADSCPACYNSTPPCLAPCTAGTCNSDCTENTGSGKLQANECTNPRQQACTKEYMPVCGWYNQDIKCVKYPCAANFGNKCEACANSQVEYWTTGACPTGDVTLAQQCSDIDGTWIDDAKECVGITEKECTGLGGTFNECASACRNDPNAEVCTMQCVQVCQFKQV